MDNKLKYMVEFTIPDPFPKYLHDMIPQQIEAVEKLFKKDILITYTLSMDKTKLWAIFVASTESELVMLIDMLPMSPYFDYDYKEIMFHDSMVYLPTMSLN